MYFRSVVGKLEIGLKGIEIWGKESESGCYLVVEGSSNNCEKLLMVKLMRLGFLLDVSGVRRKESRMTQISSSSSCVYGNGCFNGGWYKILGWERNVVVNLSLE